MKKTRYHFLDNLRGLFLFNMILYHALWDIAYIFSKNSVWFENSIFFVWQQMICMGFILLSGFCFSLSKRKYINGSLLILSSFLITLVTFLFMRENMILFGILTLLGSAYIITALFEKFFNKINSLFAILLTLLLFVGFYKVTSGFIFGLPLPRSLYNGYFMTFLGFCDRSFSSVDYFSILPWIFLFWTGFFLFKLFKEKNFLILLKTKNLPVLSFMGRHSLVIYLLHQPIIYALLWLIY